MRFACFGYIREKDWDKLPVETQNLILENYFRYHQYLRDRGVFLGGFGLKGVSEGCKLNLNGEKIEEIVLRADEDQLGGFFIIEARDMQDAKSIISNHPGLKVGAFEIRAIDETLSEIAGSILK